MVAPRSALALAATTAALVLGACVLEAQTAAQTPLPTPAAPADADADARLYERAVAKGLEFVATTQAADGSFSKAAGPAVTAIVVTAALGHGRPVTDPLVTKGLTYLETFVRPDGGICVADGAYRNYETCLAILAFSAANSGGKYDKLLANADHFIQGLQWDGEEGHDKASPSYGGAGYGMKKRPDLSNTHFLVEALKATGNGANSEAMQKALVFVSRCQNLESSHNTTPHAAKVNDGGFYYTPAGEGESQAGKNDQGGLRSYGSMTYAGLKSMIFAGVKPADPRVKAAVAWVQKNYDLKVNPGLGTPGLYYYYHTMARSLDTLGLEVIEDGANQSRHWRSELLQELLNRQAVNGAWVNPDSRWMEGDANLVTGYALLTLAHVKSPADWKIKGPTPLIPPPAARVKTPPVKAK